jgi:hypothetical protein
MALKETCTKFEYLLPKDCVGEFGHDPLVGIRCGRNITRQIYFLSSGYPQRIKSLPGCAWFVQDPVGHSVQIDFLDLSFQPPQENSKCHDKKSTLDIHGRHSTIQSC